MENTVLNFAAEIAYLKEMEGDCLCPAAPFPYDDLFQVNPRCRAHGPQPILFDMDAAAERVARVSQSPMAIHSLVSAGWAREGSGWTHPKKQAHLTQAKAYATLLWEEGSIV